MGLGPLFRFEIRIRLARKWIHVSGPVPPALAAVDIGIAMGLAGTDVAVETADVALASDDLSRLLDVRDLGRHAVGVIRQNYAMSIAVNAVGLLGYWSVREAHSLRSLLRYCTMHRR